MEAELSQPYVERRWEDSRYCSAFWFIIDNGLTVGGWYTEEDALDALRGGLRREVDLATWMGTLSNYHVRIDPDLGEAL